MPLTHTKSTQSLKGKCVYPSRNFFDQQVLRKEDLAIHLLTRFIESEWTVQEVNELCEIISREHNSGCRQMYAHMKKIGFLDVHKSFAEKKGIEVDERI